MFLDWNTMDPLVLVEAGESPHQLRKSEEIDDKWCWPVMGQNDWTIGAMENWTKSDEVGWLSWCFSPIHDVARCRLAPWWLVETQEFRPQRNLASYSRADFRTWLTDKKCREQLGKPSEGYQKKTVIWWLWWWKKTSLFWWRSHQQ